MGIAKRQIGSSFIREKLYLLHIFFFDCYWYVPGVSRGLLRVLGGSLGQSRGK